MKTFNYLGLVILGLASACHSASDQQKTVEKQQQVVKTEKQLDSTQLIVEGKQVGKIHLGQDMQAVFKLLGKPADGDAAMGSAIGIWYSNDTLKKEPLIIFSSYRDSNMVVKDVKQVSVASPVFSTAKGIHNGVRLQALKTAYPSLKKGEIYVNQKTKDSLVVYDVVNQGIAFDVQNEICTSITVHPRGKAVNAVYLTVHPDLKKVQ